MDINKIILGDCFQLLNEIPDKSVDLLLTDPPYGMNYRLNMNNSNHEKIENDDNLDWLDSWVASVKRVLKDDGMFYIFCSWHKVDVFKQTIEKYLELKNILVWNKSNFGCGDLYSNYAPKYEFIMFGNPSNKHLNGKRSANVIDAKRIPKNEIHPTQKPVELFSFLIEKSTKENDLVLDCFSGSGTTAIACHNLKRNFICIEKNEDYYEKSSQRLKALRMKKRLF